MSVIKTSATFRPAPYERLLTVRGVDYFEAFFAKSFDHELADQGVVLDD
ncbi:hypothetical protein ACVWXN_000089 [Bradyrhizobium sp. i1.4.4]